MLSCGEEGRTGEARGALTALPLGMAEFDVAAGPGRVLLGALGAADALNLIVEGFEGGVHLHVVLPQPSGRLVCPHVADGVGALLRLTQSSKSRHVDAGAGGARRTGRTGVSRRTLWEKEVMLMGCSASWTPFPASPHQDSPQGQVHHSVHGDREDRWGRACR